MLRKIKSLGAAVSVMAMTFPALVRAQFTLPEDTQLPSQSVSNIISNLMYWILSIVGILGVIAFAIAGILYLTAAGDDDRIKTAKKAMMYAIVGVLVSLLGLVVMKALQGVLGASNNI